jgi:hypothetical protein
MTPSAYQHQPNSSEKFEACTATAYAPPYQTPVKNPPCSSAEKQSFLKSKKIMNERQLYDVCLLQAV